MLPRCPARPNKRFPRHWSHLPRVTGDTQRSRALRCLFSLQVPQALEGASEGSVLGDLCTPVEGLPYAGLIAPLALLPYE